LASRATVKAQDIEHLAPKKAAVHRPISRSRRKIVGLPTISVDTALPPSQIALGPSGSAVSAALVRVARG